MGAGLGWSVMWLEVLALGREICCRKRRNVVTAKPFNSTSSQKQTKSEQLGAKGFASTNNGRDKDGDELEEELDGWRFGGLLRARMVR